MWIALLFVSVMLIIGIFFGIILKEKFVFHVNKKLSGYMKDACIISIALLYLIGLVLKDTTLTIKKRFSLLGYIFMNIPGLISLTIQKLVIAKKHSKKRYSISNNTRIYVHETDRLIKEGILCSGI